MHISFIPYGKRDAVERLLRDMEAQKHLLVMKKNDKEKSVWINAQIRVMPLGVVEYVCPKEDQDAVFATIFNYKKVPYGMGAKIPILRKILKYKKIPKFSADRGYLWQREDVAIIPIGVRYDGEITGKTELDKGWTHERI